MAELFDLARRLETAPSDEERARLKGALLASGAVLGLLQGDPDAWFQGGADDALTARVEGLIAARIDARKAKDWPEADRIRAELTELGIEVMDNSQGATWRFRETPPS